MSDTVVPAQLHRVCCTRPDGSWAWTPRAAHWELYVVLYNTTDPWPSHKWTGGRRAHIVPTVAERDAALAELGYERLPGADWEWQETETPDHHGHQPRVSFLGTVNVRPIQAGEQL